MTASHIAPIFTADLETLPAEATVWRTGKTVIGLDQLRKDWSLLSFAVKPLGQPAWFKSAPRRSPRREAGVVKAAHRFLSNLPPAALIVGHNFASFDKRILNAKFVEYGLPPVPPYRVLDTLHMARSSAFTSARLIYLTQLLTEEKKSEHSKYPGIKLWTAILDGDPEAFDEMEKYNLQDVISNEELYTILRPYYPGHPHVLVAPEAHEDPLCPRCGSGLLTSAGYHYAPVNRFQRYKCRSCGGFARLRTRTLKDNPNPLVAI